MQIAERINFQQSWLFPITSISRFNSYIRSSLSVRSSCNLSLNSDKSDWPFSIALFCSYLQQVHDIQPFCHTFPSVVGDCQCQGKRKTEHLADLFQVPVNVMDGCIILPPLFLRVFRCDDRKQVGSVGTGIFVNDSLQVRVPNNGFFFSCCFGRISQMIPFDVVLGEIKQIAAGHSICEDGEKENVTGENDGGVKVAYVHIAQLHHFLRCEPIFLFLHPVTYVNAFKWMIFRSYSIGDC